MVEAIDCEPELMEKKKGHIESGGYEGPVVLRRLNDRCYLE